MTEVILVHSNNVNSHYQQDSRVLYMFIPNKSFGQLLDISPKNFIFSKTSDSEFSNIEVRFTDQKYKPLEIEDKINITRYSIQPRDQIFVRDCGFLSFAKNMGKNISKNITKNSIGKYNQKLLNHAK